MEFKENQTVYAILKTETNVKTKCEICKGTGEIEFEGHKIKCPKTRKTKKTEYILNGSFIVKSILIQDNKIYYADDSIDLRDDMWEPYIPSFTEESLLFETVEKAKEAISKLNT